jgi:cell division protein FtsB
MQVGNQRFTVRHENGWLKAVALVIAWLIIISLARDVWRIRKGFGRITESEKRLEAEEARNLELKQKMELVQTGEFREKLIREKLNMQKEGEVVVIMPNKDLGEVKALGPQEALVSNWNKWWNLIN